MGTVILDMAMSLDGFAAGPNGEDRGLNDWLFSPAGRSREIIEESIASTGAIVMGRRTYGVGDDAEGFTDMGRRTYGVGDDAEGFTDMPYDAAHFVLTSKPPTSTPKGNVSFTFVTDGIASALEQARRNKGGATACAQPTCGPNPRTSAWRSADPRRSDAVLANLRPATPRRPPRTLQTPGAAHRRLPT